MDVYRPLILGWNLPYHRCMYKLRTCMLYMYVCQLLNETRNTAAKFSAVTHEWEEFQEKVATTRLSQLSQELYYLNIFINSKQTTWM